jgi:N-acetylglucosaminyldiphosphoundecaprenol N-acetyl-beta-D-mannosaminyltransferase
MDKTQDHRLIISLHVDVSSYEAARDRVLAAAKNREAFWLCPACVQTVMEAYHSRSFQSVMATAGLVTSDGMPLVWSLRLSGASKARRVYGPTLTETVLEAAAVEGLPVGFYGASPCTLRKLVERCQQRWPGLQIAYAYSPPYRTPTPEEDRETTCQIQASGARILFVSLGCPKHEIWAHDHYKTLNIPILAVGAAFDFIAGSKPQAPQWMQSAGLEWLFRLVTEPRRLWRRYLLGNPKFVMLFGAQMMGLLPTDRRETGD